MSSPTPTTDVDPAGKEETPGWLEPVSAFILGLAAVLTAIAAYLAAVQGGDEAEARAKQIERVSTANALSNAATQIRASDQAMFAAWADATFADNEDLAEYLTTLMRPELNTAIEEWYGTPDHVMTPFELDSYVIAEGVLSAEATKEAAAAEAKAKTAADKGDVYDQSTIFLALALFFAGVATTFRRRGFSAGLLGVGSASMIVGAIQLLVA